MLFDKKLSLQIDVMMCKKRIKSYELAKMLDITQANLSRIINQRSSAIKYDTLLKLCTIFDCQPGDLLKVVNND